MSYQSYEQTVQIMNLYPALMDFVGPRPESLVTAAEQFLDINFPTDYRRFLLDYGAGSFGSFEILGAIREGFENARVPDGIWYTMQKRKTAEMPKALITIHEFGDGNLACIDTSIKQSDGNSPVIGFVPGVPIADQSFPLIASDFGDFMLDRVVRQTKNSS